jgi:ATP-binding cassette, subfamily B, bacterial
MAHTHSLSDAAPSLGRIIRRFLPYIRKQRHLVAGGMLALVVEVVFRLLEPWPIKFIFDYVILAERATSASGYPMIDALEPMRLLLYCVLAVVLFAGMRALMAYLSTISFALTGNRVLTEVRSVLYRHLQYLSLAFHSQARSGDLTVRVISDVGILKEVVVTAALPMVGNALILFGMVAVMFWLHWQLALLSLIIFPLFWWRSTRLSGRIREASRQQRKREGAIAATAAESIGAIKLLQALSLERIFARAFAHQNEKDLHQAVKARRLMASLERSVDVFIALGTALVLWYGAQLVLRGALTPGDLLVFLTYLKSAFKPVKDFAKYTGRLSRAAASGERILDLLNKTPEIRNLPEAQPAPPFRGEVRFEQLSFGYEPGRPVLQEVDLAVRAGEQIAVVGPSGNGKSTLMNLLLRLYDSTAGRIMIDGRDIRTYTLESLRTQFSVVLQDSCLFAASVKDNIAYGAPDGATNLEIEAAARLANAHEFIMSLPRGYDTILSERGASLSGGQRQRIAIARAAVRKAPILILDEPTVGLDEENEQAVTEALQRLAAGRTTFLITHNLELAARANRIVYLEDGRVLEQGTHAQLLRADGRYAALYRLQTTAEVSGFAEALDVVAR